MWTIGDQGKQCAQCLYLKPVRQQGAMSVVTCFVRYSFSVTVTLLGAP